MEGYLLKRGRTSWKRRYCEIIPSSVPPTFSYYATKGDAIPRGVIPLLGHLRFETVEGSARRFQLVGGADGTTTVRLCAECDESLSKWRRCVEAMAGDAAGGSGGDGASLPRFGHHFFEVGKTVFELPTTYEPLRKVGRGAYGTVIAARHNERRIRVAVKKVPDAFSDLVDARRVVREMRILRKLDHENIVGVVDLPPPPPPGAFRDIYIVTDLMDADLHRVIKSCHRLGLCHVRQVVYQILCALKYLHSASVIHRDLKPHNVLISADGTVKLCDFGLARSCSAGRDDDGPDGDLTQYVVTRWYRAPEVMLCSQSYTYAIDVFALGCIMGEMLRRKPLFPGEHYVDQIKRIVDFLGAPSSPEELDFVTNERAKRYVLSLPRSEPVNWKSFLPGAGSAGRDLLQRTLVLDPSKRISVEEALEHDFFESVRRPDVETVAKRKVDWGNIERVELTKDNLQALVYDEVAAFHRSSRRLLQVGAVHVREQPSHRLHLHQ